MSPEESSRAYEQAQGLLRGGKKEDRDQAFRLLKDAAKGGHARAQYLLAMWIEGMAKQSGESCDCLTWYQLASENGIAEATARLEKGVPSPKERSRLWRTKNGEEIVSVEATFEVGTARLVDGVFRRRAVFHGSIVVDAIGSSKSLELHSGMEKGTVESMAHEKQMEIQVIEDDEWKVGNSILFFSSDRLAEVDQPMVR